MDILSYILAGAAVGLAIGITGVGGGSLMTPILLLFGFPPNVAVGTDLLYAAITKSGGVLMHKRQGTIRWRIVLLLGIGSIPASVITVLLLKDFYKDDVDYGPLLTTSLGIMLIVTSIVILARNHLISSYTPQNGNILLNSIQANPGKLTFIMGILLGITVTLSSVGAGAFAAAILLVLYPRLPSINVIGTDLTHAVPLTLAAGLGHLALGNVDFRLLGTLLVGSLPAIYVGTKIGARLPDNILQPILVITLLGLGIKYTFF